MVTKNKNNIAYYMDLNWTYTIETDHDEEGSKIFIVSVHELPGIKTDAPTLQKAMELIKDAMQGAFKLYLENNEEIPEPIARDRLKRNGRSKK